MKSFLGRLAVCAIRFNKYEQVHNTATQQEIPKEQCSTNLHQDTYSYDNMLTFAVFTILHIILVHLFLHLQSYNVCKYKKKCNKLGTKSAVK